MYFHVLRIKLISYSSLQINKNDTFYISNDTIQLLWRHYYVNDGFKSSIHIEILPFKGHFQEYCDFIAFLFCYDLDCFFLQSWVGANLNITTKKWNFDNYYNHTLIMFIIDLSHFLKWIATHEILCCFYLIKTWLNFLKSYDCINSDTMSCWYRIVALGTFGNIPSIVSGLSKSSVTKTDIFLNEAYHFLSIRLNHNKNANQQWEARKPNHTIIYTAFFKGAWSRF